MEVKEVVFNLWVGKGGGILQVKALEVTSSRHTHSDPSETKDPNQEVRESMYAGEMSSAWIPAPMVGM